MQKRRGIGGGSVVECLSNAHGPGFTHSTRDERRPLIKSACCVNMETATWIPAPKQRLGIVTHTAETLEPAG